MPIGPLSLIENLADPLVNKCFCEKAITPTEASAGGETARTFAYSVAFAIIAAIREAAVETSMP